MHISTGIVKTMAVFILLALAACKKKEDKADNETPSTPVPVTPVEEAKPSADFSTDKTEYVGGDTIRFTNISTNADTYRWTLPDGQTSKMVNITYIIPDLPVEQSLPFKLEAFSKSGNKSDYSAKIIKAIPAEGELVLYFSNNFLLSPSIKIDGKNVSSVPGFVPTANAPACGQQNFPTYKLRPGNHVVTVSEASTYTKNVIVIAGSCVALKMD
jgi:hypothetical protein